MDTTNPRLDPRLIAIRRDPMVGHDTCSVVDECYTDGEILAMLDEREIDSPAEAVRVFRLIGVTYDDVYEDVRNA